MRARGSVHIESDICKGCSLCIDACPEACLRLSPVRNTIGYFHAMLAGDTCTGCTNCALVCPDSVITVYRESRKHAAVPRELTDVKS